MVFKKIIFQNSLMANETPSRPPPPFMANAILNFHFDYWHTSLTNEQKWCKSLVLTKLSLSITLIFHWLIIIWNEVIELSAFQLFLFLMHRDELVGIQTIWWVDYQLAVGFLTGSWKSNLDVWISNHLFGNPTACLSWPRCSGASSSSVFFRVGLHLQFLQNYPFFTTNVQFFFG